MKKNERDIEFDIKFDPGFNYRRPFIIKLIF